MKTSQMLLLAASLHITACTRVRTAIEFPDLPDLSAETRRPCPGADPVTGELGDLAIKDTALAIEYAKCQARHATAVGAYDTAQRLLRSARELAERQNRAGKATKAQ